MPNGDADHSEFKSALWFVAGLVLLLALLLAITPQEHVIKCGVDEKGPYAKVLVMNLLGGYHNSNWTYVEFHYSGTGQRDATTGFDRPAHSITATVVRPDPHQIPKGGHWTVDCWTYKDYGERHSRPRNGERHGARSEPLGF